MNKFKNVIFFLLVCSASWSIAFGMDEVPQVTSLAKSVGNIHFSENKDPDQSAYFYKEDGKLYRKLFIENLRLAENRDLSSLIALINNKNVTIDQKRTAFVVSLKNVEKQGNIVNAFLQTDFDLNFYFLHKDIKDQDDKEADQYYLTPLTYVAKKGWMELLKFFLKAGANINLATPYKDGEYSNMTPLLWAANLGLEKIVHYLGIECKADPNIAQSRYAGKDAGMTALHWATNFKEVKVVEILLKCKRINVDLAQTKESGKNAGRTPLHTACKIGNFAIVKMLFYAGAKINAILTFGNKIGRTPLFSAVKGGNIDVVDFLLEKGADVNEKQSNNSFDSSGQTPLHQACRYENIDVVDSLIDWGARVNIAQTKQADYNAGMTPLHWAAYSGNDKLITYLADDCKADVNAIQGIGAGEDAGITPLHLAVLNDDIDSVSALLKCKKIKVSPRQLKCAGEKACYTPLHYACEQGFEKIINLLLLNKADANAKLNKREGNNIYSEATPLTLTLLSDYLDNKQKAHIAGLLLSQGGNASQVYLWDSIEKKQNRILEKFIKNVVDQKILNNLKTFATFCNNVGAQNIIKNKLDQVNKGHSHHHSKNKKKNRRKKRRKKRGGKNSSNKNHQSSRRIALTKNEESAEENELAELFDELCIDENGKFSVHFAQKEEIEVLEDSEAQHKIVFSGLELFGGPVLTITVKKSNKLMNWLHKVCQFGFDLSQRVYAGTRKRLKAPKAIQPAGKWNVDPATLQNPKMNNPNDPTHAFPLYMEENCCRWAVYCEEESITRYDRRDLPKGKKLADYTKKLVIYIPGKIEYSKDDGSGINSIIGYFEYVILVPKGVITSENRPLCVHRFFRPSK